MERIGRNGWDGQDQRKGWIPERHEGDNGNEGTEEIVPLQAVSSFEMDRKKWELCKSFYILSGTFHKHIQMKQGGGTKI